MKSRIIYRNGIKIGQIYQSNKNAYVKAKNEKYKLELEKLLKPLRMPLATVVNTPDFPISISDTNIITMQDKRWIYEIEHHLPAEMIAGDVIG